MSTEFAEIISIEACLARIGAWGMEIGTPSFIVEASPVKIGTVRAKIGASGRRIEALRPRIGA